MSKQDQRVYIPTPQQEVIGGHFRTNGQPRKSIIIEATAGAGKTTTLLESVLAGDDPSTLICAFNKRIQLDMESKLARRPVQGRRMIQVKTLHALGLGVLKRAWGNVQVDSKANDGLIRECFAGPPRWRFQAAKMLSYCKDVHPRIWMEPVESLVRVCLNQISDQRLLDQPTAIFEIASAVQLAMRRSCAQRPVIDFSDMVWAPIVLDLPPPGRYTRVVVDEAQDMSAAQLELIERFVAPGGSIVVVGDLNQGIYRFRGADGAAIWEQMRTKYNAETLPLTMSWRCSRAVIAEAKRLVPAIEARPDAPAGVVDTIPLKDLLQHAKPGDFILSRTNGALVSVAIDLYRRGAKPVIEGGGELLPPLLQILEKLSTNSMQSFTNSLLLWYQDQIKKADQAGGANDEWTDRVEDWFVMLSAAGERVSSPSEIAPLLRSIFEGNSDPQALSLSTVHKAKGLEARRVFLLRQSFRRYRPRREGAPPYTPSQEELNIEYVGITRAILHLTWVDMQLPKLSRGEYEARREEPHDPGDHPDDDRSAAEQHDLVRLAAGSIGSPRIRRKLDQLDRDRRRFLTDPARILDIQDGMEGFTAMLDAIAVKHEPPFEDERQKRDDDDDDDDDVDDDVDQRFSRTAGGYTAYVSPTRGPNLGYGGESPHDACDCDDVPRGLT